MNKTTFLIALFLVISVRGISQVYMQMGGGYSTVGYAAAEVVAGYHLGSVFFQGGYIAHLTRSVKAGVIPNVRAGFQIPFSGGYFIESSAGWGWIRRSSDMKYLNTSGMIGSLYAGKVINSDASLLIGGNYIEEKVIVSFVLRANIRL